MDAATRGASQAINLVLNVVANIISYIAFVAFLNSMTSFFFGLLGYDYITFQWLLGKALMPLAFMMGVDWTECEKVGELVGLRVNRACKCLLNERFGFTASFKVPKLNVLENISTSGEDI